MIIDKITKFAVASTSAILGRPMKHRPLIQCITRERLLSHSMRLSLCDSILSQVTLKPNLQCIFHCNLMHLKRLRLSWSHRWPLVWVYRVPRDHVNRYFEMLSVYVFETSTSHTAVCVVSVKPYAESAYRLLTLPPTN